MVEVVLNCILNLKITLNTFNTNVSFLLFYTNYKNEKANYFTGYYISELVRRNVERAKLLKCENELPWKCFMFVLRLM